MKLKLLKVLALANAIAFGCWRLASGALAQVGIHSLLGGEALTSLLTHFAPFTARTADGGLIPVEQFFPAKRCLACYQDTRKAWSQSLYQNAARVPFYGKARTFC